MAHLSVCLEVAASTRDFGLAVQYDVTCRKEWWALVMLAPRFCALVAACRAPGAPRPTAAMQISPCHVHRAAKTPTFWSARALSGMLPERAVRLDAKTGAPKPRVRRAAPRAQASISSAVCEPLGLSCFDCERQASRAKASPRPRIGDKRIGTSPMENGTTGSGEGGRPCPWFVFVCRSALSFGFVGLSDGARHAPRALAPSAAICWRACSSEVVQPGIVKGVSCFQRSPAHVLSHSACETMLLAPAMFGDREWLRRMCVVPACSRGTALRMSVAPFQPQLGCALSSC